MKQLLITLGHNSSAVLVEDKQVLVGYEEERLSGVKADSSFPKLAINRILKYYPEARYEVDTIYVSHWFWGFDLEESKYYQPKFLKAKFVNAKVKSVDYYNTHHDLHARSVWNFCDGDKSGLTIVADGFGNCGECLSIYKDGELDWRSYSVNASLGLMYQYATAYLGMKENQDEYKLLGYETKASEDFKLNIVDKINDTSNKLLNILFNHSSMNLTGHEGMIKQLAGIRRYWYGLFSTISKEKAEIAYFVQSVLENVILEILNMYNCKNIKCSGGVFYNVKLNNRILEYADTLEVNPLSGDQGCALGFIDVDFGDLAWGIRPIIFGEGKYAEDIIREISEQGYSEVVMGNMEFGPRALGHTTCLALPTMEMVDTINKLNGRDTVMPMAPMVTEEVANSLFVGTDKVGKSKEFMIIAFDYVEMNEGIRGAAHKHPDKDVYTGRIQVVKSGLLKEVLEHFGGILINTSLNAHGQPIIYNRQDYDYMKYIQDSQNS